MEKLWLKKLWKIDYILCTDILAGPATFDLDNKNKAKMEFTKTTTNYSLEKREFYHVRMQCKPHIRAHGGCVSEVLSGLNYTNSNIK